MDCNPLNYLVTQTQYLTCEIVIHVHRQIDRLRVKKNDFSPNWAVGQADPEGHKVQYAAPLSL